MIQSFNVSARELPIYRRAVSRYEHLWHIYDAKHFCEQLCRLAAVPGITLSEYNNAAKVANGEMWPAPDRVYTREDWEADGTFSPVAGQEIAPEIYDYMLDVTPPRRLPRCERTADYSAGFLLGEPDSEDRQGRMLYGAFGQREGRCYYIGLLPSA